MFLTKVTYVEPVKTISITLILTELLLLFKIYLKVIRVAVFVLFCFVFYSKKGNQIIPTNCTECPSIHIFLINISYHYFVLLIHRFVMYGTSYKTKTFLLTNPNVYLRWKLSHLMFQTLNLLYAASYFINFQ